MAIHRQEDVSTLLAELMIIINMSMAHEGRWEEKPV